MRYSGLRFFNGTNSEIQLEYDSTLEKFTGSIHMNEVSTGLFEVVTLFVLEEAVGPYGAPVLIKPIGSGVTSSKFGFEMFDTNYTNKNINLLTATVVNGEPYANIETVIESEVQDNSVAVSTTNGIHTVGTSYAKEALQVNIGLRSEDEGTHLRFLRIYDTIDDHDIAIISIYGETVGEDERLQVLLNNFGAGVSTADQFLFKDHDINEVATDWKLINAKRKELLLELSNIKPFVGTYKALVNAIKFFGYNNLTLKEYWLVIDDRSPMFGKMKAFEVPNSSKGAYVENKIKGIQLPSSTYKKTSRFGLFYKINTPNGQFDEWDIQQVEEVFDFTPDEVLIKLYGLKSKLQREYLPLHAKIIDVIGEGDFFTNYNTNIWNNQNAISVVSGGVEPNIEIHQEDPFIEDLTKVSTLFTGKSQNFAALNATDMATIYTDTGAFYTGYYNLNRSTFQGSAEGLPVGAPVMLECTSFDDTWDAAEFTWNDAESYITWENWWKRNVYELRWYISGPKNWSQTIIGPIDDVLKIAIALPYKGTYEVRFEQVDLFNSVTVLPKAGTIEAKMKEVEIYGVYRWMDKEYYDWQTSNFKWGKAGGSWGFPQQNDDTVDQEIGTLYLTLDRANYLHDESKGINFSMVRRYADLSSPTGFSETAGPYFWRNLKPHTWNDGKHTWWDATRVGADLAASFKIIKADAGSTFTIEYRDYNTNTTLYGSHVISNDLNDPFLTNEFQAAADDLNASTDPIISKFTYNPIFLDTPPADGSIDPGIDQCLYILAVGKEYSKSYDFEDVYESVPSTGIVLIDAKINYVAYNPTFNDVQIAESHAEIEMLTHMTFSADKSMMPGKLKYAWKLQNNSQDVTDIYYDDKWLTYLFERKGDYTLELEVTDVNGNTNKLVKNTLTVK